MSHESLIDAHTDLMPELSDQLRRLRLIEQAHVEASSYSDEFAHRLRVRCPHCRNSIEITEEAHIAELACPACDGGFSLLCESDPWATESPNRLGHFELRERVGVGAFGTVWRAHDVELDREVAVKIPRKGQLSAMETKNFIREARTAAQLNHPHIVRVYEIGREDDLAYIVTDLVQGQDLGDWLEENQLSPSMAARLCAKVADALHHAHQRGVIHRDLKPSNIMITAQEKASSLESQQEFESHVHDGLPADSFEPRLTDFGLARRVGIEPTVTLDGRLLGTPAYMSPEQARGAAHEADRRSDIYSLGVILFELFTGERPFRGSTQMLVHQILFEEAPSPRQLNVHVPKDLETICLKCLEKAPDHRYQTAKQVSDDLRRFLNGRPVQARPVSRMARALRWCNRNPMPATLLSMLFFTLSAGIVAVTSLWIHAEVESRRAGAAQQRAETESELRRHQQYISDMVAANLAWKTNDVDRCALLLKRHLPERERNDVRRFEWYYLWNLCQPSLTTPSLEVEFASIAISPHGEMAAVGREKMCLLSLSSGSLTHSLPNAQMGPVTDVEFRPPLHEVLASCNLDGTLKLWNPMADSNPVVVYDAPGISGYAFYSLSFSPDGSLLATNAAGEEGFVLWDVESASKKAKYDVLDQSGEPVQIRSVAFSPDGSALALGGYDGLVRLWDVDSHETHELWKHDDGNVDVVSFSADGSMLASSGRDKLIRLGDVTNRQHKATLAGHDGYIFGMAFSPNGQLLATASWDRTVGLWDVQSVSLIKFINAHDGKVVDVAFSADSQILASSGWDGKVKRWDLSRPTRQDTFNGDIVSFSEDGQTLISKSGWTGNKIKRWRIATGQSTESPMDELNDDGSVDQWLDNDYFLALASDQEHLAVGTNSGHVEIWDLATKTKSTTICAHEDKVHYLSFSSEGDILATAKGNDLKLWDVASARLIRKFLAFTGANTPTNQYAFSISPDSRTLAYSKQVTERYFELELWDIGGNRSIAVHQDTSPVTAIAFTSDSTQLATGRVTGGLIIWDSRTGNRIVGPIRAHSDVIRAMAFSPDGTRLASASDRTITLWDVPSGDRVITLDGHSGRIRSLAFSPDGRMLASSDENEVVNLWRAHQ